ncbi:unnamed protein product [Owenia fusiformis]|uniref:Uncharacterized protein n=1 Tax=Owenia fusiformis TaxID=6347 RepID=A0A8J1TYF4_OWEFU|nr:unnamed protein product [Owenia fusiformis]
MADVLMKNIAENIGENETETVSSSVNILNDLSEIIEDVLRKLPAKSLNTCSRVCKRWHDSVKRIKKRRQQFSWIHYEESMATNIKDEIDSVLQNMSSEPGTALIFCSNALQMEQIKTTPEEHVGQEAHQTRARSKKVTVLDYIKSQLPQQCRVATSVTAGVVSTTFDNTKCSESETDGSLTCLLLPKIPGLDIYTFSFDGFMDLPDSEPESNYFNWRSEHCLWGIQNNPGFPEGVIPKLLLQLSADHYFPNQALTAALYGYFKQKIVVAGGMVDDVYLESCQEDDDDDILRREMSTLGIAFCGDDTKVASVIVPADVTNPKQVESVMSQLRGSHIPDSNRIGFMFACIGRGYGLYHKQNVESEIFRKLFPKTPLYGFYGNGEIGYNYLPDYSDIKTCDESSDEELPIFQHGYTTIIVLVSLS